MSGEQSLTRLVGEVMQEPPLAAVVLGSGLGSVVERCRIRQRLPFTEVAELALPSVTGHAGQLTLADWIGRRVVLFEGRLHYYEGHSWEQVVAIARLAQVLTARLLILTNAAGGILDALEPGSIMIIRDHLEWTWPYCWRRPGPGGLGCTRPPPYSSRLVALLGQAAVNAGLACHTGIYAAVTGPCFETAAEIQALKKWGADAVGMSTAREAQHACDLGLECVAASLITNRAAGLSDRPIHHEEVLEMGKAGSQKVGDLLESFLQLL
jgi:purine-nucleoside phosphorylase